MEVNYKPTKIRAVLNGMRTSIRSIKRTLMRKKCPDYTAFDLRFTSQSMRKFAFLGLAHVCVIALLFLLIMPRLWSLFPLFSLRDIIKSFFKNLRNEIHWMVTVLEKTQVKLCAHPEKQQGWPVCACSPHLMRCQGRESHFPGGLALQAFAGGHPCPPLV